MVKLPQGERMANFLTREKPSESLRFVLRRKDLGRIVEPSEADLYVFSILSYLRFEKMAKAKVNSSTISALCSFLLSDKDTKKDLSQAERAFISALEHSPRFANIRISHFNSIFDEANQITHANLLIHLPGKRLFLSYRGTDETLLSWKEDANMATTEVVPSEEIAAKTLDKLMDDYPQYSFYVGGHSKGGILAVFAASSVSEEKQKRIRYVMDCDCPGFKGSLISMEGYERILPKVHTFIPEYSIVGLVFRKKQPITVITSSSKGPLSHYHFTWDIEYDHLVHTMEYASGTELDKGHLNEMMSRLTDAQLRDYMNTIYQLLKGDDDNLTLSDAFSPKNFFPFMARFGKLSASERKNIRIVSGILLDVMIRYKPKKAVKKQ